MAAFPGARSAGAGIMDSRDKLVAELKQLIVDALRLEDITPGDIGSDQALFDGGLGLDSIDALELGMAISKKYSIKLSREKRENSEYFQTVNRLADMVQDLARQAAAPTQ